MVFIISRVKFLIILIEIFTKKCYYTYNEQSQVTGHRSQVTGHRSQVTGHRSQVTGHSAPFLKKSTIHSNYSQITHTEEGNLERNLYRERGLTQIQQINADSLFEIFILNPC